MPKICELPFAIYVLGTILSSCRAEVPVELPQTFKLNRTLIVGTSKVTAEVRLTTTQRTEQERRDFAP